MSTSNELALFLGHFHPLLIHLPIGFILLLGFLELLARSPRFKGASANAGLILALAVPASLGSALCGWLLSLGGGYPDPLLQWHKWTGIATAGLCLVAGLLYSLELKKLYRWSLAGSVAVLAITSHFGGSLTHGSDYLVKFAPAPLRKLLGGQTEPQVAVSTTARDPLQLQAFGEVIKPILQTDCVSCHGPDKSKGKLRLDSYQAILKGGDTGPTIVPGKSSESTLVKRVRLPSTDQDHMPPEGKPQPGADDLALVQWWVDAGAPESKQVGELKPPANIARLLETRFGHRDQVAKTVLPKPLSEVQASATILGDQLGIALTALSPNDPWLQCNASVAGTNFGDTELAKLAPLGANLRWLDLAGTRVTDSGLSNVAAMANLTRLHLERTSVTDLGLPSVTSLASLEYLNLYGTQITDSGLPLLRDLPKLKQVYLWQTKVTPAAAATFAASRTDEDEIRKWQEEIERLKSQIRDAHITVELGTTSPVTTASAGKAINANCPVSGKPVDPSKSVIYEGKLVAFCCDDCKAQFLQDPKPFLAKLDLNQPNHNQDPSIK